ncbi:MAG: hypothetical protein H7X93_00195 [Sphingomonadaceae bacterium]|nr:hypothetical protein [Sphingomonadaceae bacterium]
MNRVRETRANAILNEELDRVDWAERSAFTVRDGERGEAGSLEWWHQNTPDNERSETTRSLGYLRAYLRIAGEDAIYATGIRLHRRVLWMDRSVMSRLERDGYLQFDGSTKVPRFLLTDKGRAWVQQDGWSLHTKEVV